jgi:hypothetical protein
MTADELEQEATGWLTEAGYVTLFGPDNATNRYAPKRDDYV